jgi:hypothetical protein
MNFMNKIGNFLDAQNLYKVAFKNHNKEGGFSL